MKLSSLHILLTYRCTLACDHCFVWSSPRQTGTMSLDTLRQILAQAADLDTIQSIYFEGGEPFMCCATLLEGTREAKRLGFAVGIVSNGFWASRPERALRTLRPFAGLVDDLLISSDVYHGGARAKDRAGYAAAAAGELSIPCSVINITEPETAQASPTGQLPAGEHGVMYRGRAAAMLARRARPQPWKQLGSCTYENLRAPARIHVDPYGYLHICQGIALGNLTQTPLRELCERYDPEAHPITGPLLAGGPAELVQRYGLPHAETYADACHLCDHARRLLRAQYRDVLTPDEMYGVPVHPPTGQRAAGQVSCRPVVLEGGVPRKRAQFSHAAPGGD
jgi:hypothetical protein